MKSYRKEKGLTLEQLAKKLGISKSYLSMIENGTRRLSYEMAVQIANNLEKTPDEIFLPDYFTRNSYRNR
jgi:putative transcriptional regulator